MDIYVHKMNIYLHRIDFYVHAINIDVHNLNICVHKMNIFVDSCRRNVGVGWPGGGEGSGVKQDAAPFQLPCRQSFGGRLEDKEDRREETRIRKAVDDREPSPYIFS